jgi:serine/threonine protein kinase
MQDAERHLKCLQALGLPPLLFEKLPGASSRYFERAAKHDENDEAALQGNYGEVTIVRPTAFAQKNLTSLDMADNSKFALKRYRAASLSPEEQLRIAIPLYNLHKNPHLVQYIAAYEFDDGPALLMNWVDGHSLIAESETPRRKTEDDERRWACWLRDIAQALEYMHERGIVHRDVHRGNILIRKDNSSGRKSAVLIDLDLACTPLQCQYLCAGPANTETTPYDLRRDGAGNASMDQWRASDVFALAATFLGYAAHNPAFLKPLLIAKTASAQSSGRIEKAIDATVQTATQRFVGDLNLQRILQMMLASDWTERPSAAQVVDMLQPVSCDQPDSNLLQPHEKDRSRLRIYSTNVL